MFEYVKDNTLFWFDKHPLECGLNFELVGMLLGLSIYNNVNLDLHFPLLVYKKLIDMKIDIEVIYNLGFIWNRALSLQKFKKDGRYDKWRNRKFVHNFFDYL